MKLGVRRGASQEPVFVRDFFTDMTTPYNFAGIILSGQLHHDTKTHSSLAGFHLSGA